MNAVNYFMIVGSFAVSSWILFLVMHILDICEMAGYYNVTVAGVALVLTSALFVYLFARGMYRYGRKEATEETVQKSSVITEEFLDKIL